MKTITYDETLWQLVPVEMRTTQANAGWRALVAQGIEPEDVEIDPVYRALLANAPQSPAVDDDVRRDAELWRFVVRENNKGPRGKFRICWIEPGDDGFTTTDGVSCDGKDEQAIVRVVAAAMAEGEEVGREG